MKPRRLSDLRDLVASTDFQAWYEELLRARRMLKEAREAYDELLSQSMLMDFRAELAQKNAIDTLYRANEFEDSAARLAADCQELENASFKTVADFEEQRYRASDAWYRMVGLDRQADDQKDQLASLRGKIAQAAGPDRRETEAELARLEGEAKVNDRVRKQAAQDYERENARKQRLWEQVEQIWARSAELSLLTSEKRMQGAKVRAEAEQLFKQAEERKQRAKKLKAEADQAGRGRDDVIVRLADVTKSAIDRFACAAGEEFLYFRQNESAKAAFCVALVDDPDHYNLEVRPLAIFRVDMKRGVEFLEPAGATPVEGDSDRRFDDYFLQGRKGRAGAESGTPT